MQKAQSPDVSDKVQQYIDKQLDKRQRPKKTVKKSGFTTLVQGVVSKARKLDDRLTFQGMKISIETDKGNVRSGVDPNGHEWKTVMPRPYGYIRGTLGVDGDHLDCVSPDTMILLSNMQQKRAGDLSLSDVLVGFDEYPEVGKMRKFREAKIEHLKRCIGPMLRIYLKSGDVLSCTPGHQWLSYKGNSKTKRWLKAKYLTPGKRLVRVQKFSNWRQDDLYRRGYLAGLIEGDGHFRFSSVDPILNPRLTIRMADLEPLQRVMDYLEYFGLKNLKIAPGGIPSSKSKKPIFYIKTCRRDNLEIVESILEERLVENKSWCRGFVSGFFDAEGGIAARSEVTVSQKDILILDLYKKSVEQLGFSAKLRKSSGKTYGGYEDVSTVVLESNRDNTMLRFFFEVFPSISRKIAYLYSHIVNWMEDEVVAVEEYDGEYIAIQTDSGTYVANGMASHNCTVGPNEDADRVWVIHTKERGTDKYDEDKAFVGFDTKEDVIATFRKQFDQPDLHMGPVSEYSMEDFKEKIKDTRDNPRRLGRGKNVSKSFRTRVTKD